MRPRKPSNNRPKSGSGNPYSDKSSGFKKREGSSESSRPKKSFGDKDLPFKSSDDRPKRSGSDSRKSSDSRPFKKRDDSFSKDKGGFEKKKFDGESSFSDRKKPSSFSDRRDKSSDSKPYKKRDDGFSKNKDGFSKKKFDGESSYGDRKKSSNFSDKKERSSDSKPFKKRDDSFSKDGEGFSKKKFDGESSFSDRKKSFDSKSFKKRDDSFSKGKDKSNKTKFDGESSFSHRKKTYSEDVAFDEKTIYNDKKRSEIKDSAPKKDKKKPSANKNTSGDVRLNKYLSNAGICSRRDADVLIQTGAVTVNGKIVTELGYKIKYEDVVAYGGVTIKQERKVYLLLNKPKDYITTTEDPQERKTVMELIKTATKERIYPVGRLDRNTTGLLLFTNDGDMATKLMHPKFGIKKVYHVSLNKGFKPEDFSKMKAGLELEDGMIKPDDLAYVEEGKKEIGIEVHSGRNRIVRRMFEHLGYDVLKLDRVVFAGLTKKDLPRGKWRFLSEKEVNFLRMIG